MFFFLLPKIDYPIKFTSTLFHVYLQVRIKAQPSNWIYSYVILHLAEFIQIKYQDARNCKSIIKEETASSTHGVNKSFAQI